MPDTLKKLQQELDKKVGDDELRVLKEILDTLKKSPLSEKHLKVIEGYESRLLAGGADVKSLLTDLKKELEAIKNKKAEFPKEQDVRVINPVKYPRSVEIKNPKEIADYIKIPDVKIPSYPEEIDVKESKWLAKYIEPIIDVVKQAASQVINVKIKNRKPEEAVPVQLVTKDGKKFYTAITQLATAVNRGVPYKTSAGVYKEALIDDSGRLQVEVVSSDITEPTDFEGAPVVVGTTAVELTFTGTTSSIMIQSDPDNTGQVWVGKSNVTSAGANAMFELSPGQSFGFDYNDSTNAVYVVSNVAAQNVYKFATL